MLKLDFKYSKEEYVKAVRKYLIASKIISKFSIIFLALFIIFSIYYGIATSFGIFSIIFLAICFFVLVIGSTLYFYAPIKAFNQTAKFKEEYHLEFSQDIIRFKTTTIDSEIKWNAYSEIWENKDFYFMIQTANAYTIIPKRAFKTERTIQGFEKIVLLNFNTIKHL